MSTEENELPKAVIARLLKNALPTGTSLQKEARIAVNRAGTVFVNHLASLSNDVAKESNHRSITNADVFRALELADLEHLIEPLKESLEAFRKLVSEKKEKNKKDESKPKEEDKAKMEEEEEDIQIVESVLSPKVLDDMPNEEEF